MIEYPYHARRAAQATHYLLWRAASKLDLYAVVKLLYLAERETLRQTGESLTGDHLVSMPFGPTPSLTYDLVKGNGLEEYPSAQYIKPRRGNELKVQQPVPGPNDDAAVFYDELSERAQQTLGRLVEKYSDYSFADLKAVVHDLPEYDKEVGASSKPIDPATILRDAGWSETDIKAVQEDAAGARAFRRLLKIT
jgi:uncharacterized phage-associated protein